MNKESLIQAPVPNIESAGMGAQPVNPRHFEQISGGTPKPASIWSRWGSERDMAAIPLSDTTRTSAFNVSGGRALLH